MLEKKTFFGKITYLLAPKITYFAKTDVLFCQYVM